MARPAPQRPQALPRRVRAALAAGRTEEAGAGTGRDRPGRAAGAGAQPSGGGCKRGGLTVLANFMYARLMSRPLALFSMPSAS